MKKPCQPNADSQLLNSLNPSPSITAKLFSTFLSFFSASPMAPRFFKVILQQTLESNHLMLPTSFTRKYHTELSDSAHLSTPDGRVWKLGLQNAAVSFTHGFHEFASHYSLSHGHWLVFKYQGMSRFSVRIYDKSSCEISYSSYAAANQTSSITKNPRQKAKTAGVKAELTRCKYTSKCGITSPRHFKSRRPYFEVKLKDYNFSLNVVYVSSSTVSESMGTTQVKSGWIWLEDSDGRQWKVSILKRGIKRLSLGKLKTFYLENGLKVGDVCVFELVEKDLLKVFIFSAV